MRLRAVMISMRDSIIDHFDDSPAYNSVLYELRVLLSGLPVCACSIPGCESPHAARQNLTLGSNLAARKEGAPKPERKEGGALTRRAGRGGGETSKRRWEEVVYVRRGPL